jgi:hypothetical protein
MFKKEYAKHVEQMPGQRLMRSQHNIGCQIQGQIQRTARNPHESARVIPRIGAAH